MNPSEYKNFKRDFWVWYDSLLSYERHKLMYYKEDIAETNFYFSVYAKRRQTDAR